MPTETNDSPEDMTPDEQIVHWRGRAIQAEAQVEELRNLLDNAEYLGQGREEYLERVEDKLRKARSGGVFAAKSFFESKAKETKDSLTGLLNYGGLEEAYRKLKELPADRKVDSPWPCSVLFIDVDGFKAVNDRYEHTTGNNLLKLLAETFTGNLRSYDVVGRPGGDEFVILLPHTDKEDASQVAEKLRQHVEDIKTINHKAIDISLSIGVDELHRTDSDMLAVATMPADQAMYRAKHTGGNRVEVVGNTTRAT